MLAAVLHAVLLYHKILAAVKGNKCQILFKSVFCGATAFRNSSTHVQPCNLLTHCYVMTNAGQGVDAVTCRPQETAGSQVVVFSRQPRVLCRNTCNIRCTKRYDTYNIQVLRTRYNTFCAQYRHFEMYLEKALLCFTRAYSSGCFSCFTSDHVVQESTR